MTAKTFNRLLLCGAISMGLAAQAQQSQPADWRHPDADLAITYQAERGKVASIDCGCFWLQGGGADASVSLFHGLGVAAKLTGGHATEIESGVDLSKVTFGVGPRYTYRMSKWKDHPMGKHSASIYGETLFGLTHAFDSIFPSSDASGTRPADTSFAWQLGGGIDIGLTNVIGIRAIEADYVRSTLPNNGNNVQNDLRLGVGLSLHLHR